MKIEKFREAALKKEKKNEMKYNLSEQNLAWKDFQLLKYLGLYMNNKSTQNIISKKMSADCASNASEENLSYQPD